MGLYKGILTKGNRIEMDRIKKTENLFWEKFGINKTCQSCQKSCKQHAGVELVSCKMFRSNGGKIMKQEPTMMKTEDLMNEVAKTNSKRSRAKLFAVINFETGEAIETKSVRKWARENLDIEDVREYKKLLNTINTGREKFGYIVKIIG